MPTPDEWAVALARQAKADISTWNYLQTADLPECKKLLFLQMACEKLVKAHLCDQGSAPSSLQSSHAYTAKNLPGVIRVQLTILRAKPKLIRAIVSFTKRIAREIELLAPAVDDGGRRPDNCEYPWEDRGHQLWVPVDWTFFTDQFVKSPVGLKFLKLVHEAIERFASPTS